MSIDNTTRQRLRQRLHSVEKADQILDMLIETSNIVNSLVVTDHHSGFSVIPHLTSETIMQHKQSINFTKLELDGDLVLEGDLWLA